MKAKEGSVRLRIENIYSRGWFGRKNLDAQIYHIQQFLDGEWRDVPCIVESVQA